MDNLRLHCIDTYMDMSMGLDNIHSCSRGISYPLKNRDFSRRGGESFLFKKRKSKRGSYPQKIRCSLLEEGLKPRPQHLKLESEFLKLDGSFRKQSKITEEENFCSGICNQIEKLVLHGRHKEALELFEILECEGEHDVGASTYEALVSACIGLKSIRGVKRVFNFMVGSGFEPDLYLRNRVLLMHVKCGMMKDAQKLFDEMPEKNIVSWNTIIGGLVDLGDYREAFRLFLIMWRKLSDAGSRTLATMIRASAGLEFISPGRQIHSLALKMGFDDDIYVTCALIDMYSKCGSIKDARFVFDELPEKTTVGWNSIIAGYALHGYSEEALHLFYQMRDSGGKMDHFTFSMIVRVCSRLASGEHAKQAHAGLIRHGFGFDIVANTALVDFYSKWEKIEDARNVFERMPQKNVICWNALIAGYGNHGRGSEAVGLFRQMIREGMVPNHVTFLAVLSACSYSGLSDLGWEIFESMSRDFKVKPRAMHYACMIELLGREGLLDEALALIQDAPFEPTANMWAALLTACRAHKNLLLGKFAAEKLYGMEPEKLTNYVVLLNIYNRSGKLKEAAAVIQTLRRKGLRMLPACTWIGINKEQCTFFSGDKHHPQIKQIYEKLDELMQEISKHGYFLDGKSLLPDVDEREEELRLHHSEKLAITFGLINTKNSTPLRLVQNHRICGDCHNVIKVMTKVIQREIIVRDGSRFHRFKMGTCSCGDYW